MIGRVVFDDAEATVFGDIVGCTLTDGKIVLHADVPWPHPSFNANVWRVHGSDGTVIYTLRGTGREPVIVAAYDDAPGTTHVTLPVAFTGGPDILPALVSGEDPTVRLREPRWSAGLACAVELLTAVRADGNVPQAEFAAAVDRMAWTEIIDAVGALAALFLSAERISGIDLDWFVTMLGLVVAERQQP